jgi:PAS domain S-box-containing protein
VQSVEDYAIFMLDPEGRVLTWNRGAQRIKGYSASEIVGRHFSAFYAEEDIALHEPERGLEIAARDGRVEDEGWRIRKDGSRFWANVVLTAMRDESGGIQGFGKVTRDLTERRMAAEELRLSEQRFRLLVESVSDYAIYLLDPLGNVSSWNAGAERIKGYQPAEILGRYYAAFFSAEDIAAGRPELELGTARRLGHFEEEGWRVRKSGERFWANVVLTALTDATGKLVGFSEIARDLTTRKRAEEISLALAREQAARTAAETAERQIREERERFKTLSRRLEVIFEGIADGITVQSRSGTVVFANMAAARLSGFATVDEFLQTPTNEVTARFDLYDEHGRTFDLATLPARRIFEGAESAQAIMRVVDRSSRRQWWSIVRSNPVGGDQGIPELAVNIWHDVTAERRREEHERYLAEATSALTSSLDYEAMLRTLAGLLVPSLADWCTIHLLDGEELKNVAQAHADVARAEKARSYSRRYPPEPTARGGVWNVLRTGRAELHPEVSDQQLELAAKGEEQLRLLREIGVKSLITAPITVRGHVSGTISLASTESARRYDELDKALAEDLGRRAGTAIDNARLYAAERKARERLELIARAGTAFSSSLDYEVTLRAVVEIVLPTLADFAFFDVIEGAEVRRVAQAYDDPEFDALIRQTRFVRSTRRDKNLCALSSGSLGFHPLIDDAWRRDVATSPEHLELLQRSQLASMITVPMTGRGDLLGSLTLCFGKSGRHHTSEDVPVAEELARRASAAVLQARLFATVDAAARTATKAAAAAEQASRVKDEFLATVSHELRTPLNAILGWASLLRDSNPDQATKNGLDVIHRNAHAQAKLIEDILDVSRIITGKLRLEATEVDLMRVIEDAIEVVRPTAAAKGITINLAPLDEPALLTGDAERLQQVVWNLLSNALKFTDAGGAVTIVVTQTATQITVEVSDNGRGIEADFLPLVFDRFKQADSSTTRRIGGLGLGLAIVRHIVELHGGRVSVTSAGLGQGSTFSVELPVRVVVAESPESSDLQLPTANGARPAAPSLAGLRVLVVEDELDALELMRLVLTRAGAEVAATASAAEAFERLQAFRPNAIVSDIAMPGENGLSLMRRIRALAVEQCGTVPALALTAYTRTEDKASALAAGFTTHLGKPIHPEELIAAVANLVFDDGARRN